MKKWITAIVCIIIITAFGLLVYFNIDAIKSNSTLYTKEQMDEAYNTGYNDGLKNEQDYIYQINELLTKIKELEADIDLYKPLAEENPELKNQIIILQSNIKELEERISLLEAELEYYKDLENENLIFIKFFVDDEIYRTIALNSGETITDNVTNPIKENYTFMGWCLNDNIINIYTTTFDKSIELHAKFNKEVNGIYIFNYFDAIYQPSIPWPHYYGLEIKNNKIVSFRYLDTSNDYDDMNTNYIEDGEFFNCEASSFVKTEGNKFIVSLFIDPYYADGEDIYNRIYEFTYNVDEETLYFTYYYNENTGDDIVIENWKCERIS